MSELVFVVTAKTIQGNVNFVVLVCWPRTLWTTIQHYKFDLPHQIALQLLFGGDYKQSIPNMSLGTDHSLLTMVSLVW